MWKCAEMWNICNHSQVFGYRLNLQGNGEKRIYTVVFGPKMREKKKIENVKKKHICLRFSPLSIFFSVGLCCGSESQLEDYQGRPSHHRLLSFTLEKHLVRALKHLCRYLDHRRQYAFKQLTLNTNTNTNTNTQIQTQKYLGRKCLPRN